MTTCRGCGALVQPEWDRCKICGFDGESVEDEPSSRGRKRRSRRGRHTHGAPSAAAAAPNAPAGAVAAPPAPSAPVITFDSPAVARTKTKPARPRTGGKTEAPVWLLGAGLVAVIVGCLVIIFKEPPDPAPPPTDVPAAETDAAAGAPEWEALGEWTEYSGTTFSVELPGIPLQNTESITVPNVGEMEMRFSTVVATGSTVTVAFAPVPDGLRARPDLVVDGLLRTAAERLEGEVAATKDVTIDGYTAVRARVESTVGEVRMAVVVDGENVFLLQADAEDQGTLYLQRLIDTFDT
jgi:hypothetical protein